MVKRSPTFTLKPLPPEPKKEKFTFNQLPATYRPAKLGLDEKTQEYFLVAEHTTGIRDCGESHEPGCRHFDLPDHAPRKSLLYIGPADDFAQVLLTNIRVYRGGGVFYEYVRADKPGTLYFPGTDKSKSPTNSYNGKRAKLTDLSDRL